MENDDFLTQTADKYLNKEENSSIVDMFGEDLLSVMGYIENTLSKEMPTLVIDVEYFILGVLMHRNNKLYNLLESCLMSHDIEKITTACYQVVSSRVLSAIKPNRKQKIGSLLMDIFNKAKQESKSLGSNEIDTDHVFLAILNDETDTNKIKLVFNKVGINYSVMRLKIQSRTSDNIHIQKENKIEEEQHYIDDDIINSIKFPGNNRVIFLTNNDSKNQQQDKKLQTTKKKAKNSYISEYCTNLNELAKKGLITELIGRDREVNEIIKTLGRKKKNNTILVGGEGVGKTAICESIALKIVQGNVPSFLLDKIIVSLDMTAVMAGTTLRGMFEERIKGILEDIKTDGRFILFMDNIGATLADKGKNDYEISAMLSRALENGEAQVIGTSDFLSYRKTFDKDPSLARRFQKIIVEPPTLEDSLKILFGIRESYEEFHNVKYSDEAVSMCVKLANRYITERNLPDSAIDILDESGSLIGTVHEPEELVQIKKEIAIVKTQIEKISKTDNFDLLESKQTELNELTSEYATIQDEYNESKKNNVPEVTVDDILKVVSNKTNIPIKNLTSNDKEKLIHINDRLKQDIIGQDDAIDTICKALKRNRIGLHKNGCMYSAIEIGKTGTGKTLLAKKLAKELFGTQNALVRFDMSEFSDKVSVNKLIGSNPGYVGYEEGGQLTEAIKNKKHCVLLLDEIEKADPEIYNIFLQVLDEGFLTDNSGQKIDFKNVIIIFTSNIGVKAAADFGNGIGFAEDVNLNSKKILTKQLKNKFPPEFLNRIDDVIYFNSLTDDNLKQIIKIEINNLEKKLNDIGYSCKYNDSVVEYILGMINDEKEYGARPVLRAIQDNIENKITDAILENDYNNNHTFVIEVQNNENNREVVVR